MYKYIVAIILFILFSFSIFANAASEKISMSFKDADVREVLQILADAAKINLILSEAVKGKITINLENMSYQQALTLIMVTQHLAKRVVENTIFITTEAEAMAAKEQILQIQKRLEDLTPLQTTIIKMRYAKAEEVMQAIKISGNGLLSTRGKIIVDNRTNSLVLQDLKSNLSQMISIIHALDKPMKQVAIEARVVNVDRNFNRELGARLGLRHQGMKVAGSLEQLYQDPANQNNNMGSKLNVNLPQMLEGTVSTGQIAIAMAKLGAGIALDTELSAMESLGKGEVISHPHLLTADQQAATIEAGEEIPYQETSASGATSVSFKKAVLRLQVTPQITPDKQILLKLIVNQDKRSSKPEVLGVPAIDTRHLETQVLVSNGETIVLGGIFEHAKNDSNKRVPFFAELPLLGQLFQNRATGNQQTELLIFVTPTIIE